MFTIQKAEPTNEKMRSTTTYIYNRSGLGVSATFHEFADEVRFLWN